MNLITRNDCFAIFGSTGMAGSAISRALRGSNYCQLLEPSRQELNLLDPIAVQEWFVHNKPTVVILAAAKVGGIYANSTYPADFLLENLKIQINVIEASWRSGVKRLLFLGSSCIYPKFANQPISENALLTGELEPTNECYAIAKIAGIKLCESLRKQHGFDAICLMPTNLYGPGDNYHPQNSHVIPALISRFYNAKLKDQESVTCWGTGSPLREFLHVDDLGAASVFALENWKPRTNDNVFLNVGTGTDLTINELAHAVAKAIGFEGKILWDLSKPDGTPQKKLCVDEMASLGWSSRIPLEEGLKSTVLAYENELRAHNVRSQ